MNSHVVHQQQERYQQPGDRFAVDRCLNMFENRLGPSFRELSRQLSRSLDNSISFLEDLAGGLSALSTDITNIDERAAFYARESASALDEFLHSDVFEVLFIRRGLAADTTYLYEHFGTHVDAILRGGVQPRNYESAVSGIRGLYEATRTIRELVYQWSDLRYALAAGLEEVEVATIRYEDFDELRHSIHNGIYPRGTDKEFQFSLWPGVLSNLQAIGWLSQFLKGLFARVGWKFDTICTMSASTMPLVAHLALEVHARWVACDNRTFNFTRPLREHERVLLLDTVVDTGSHFREIKRRVEEATGEPISGFFCLVRNDLQGPTQARSSIDFSAIYNLVYLYKMSELYEVWRAQREKAAPEEVSEISQVPDEELRERLKNRLEGFSRDMEWIDSNYESLRREHPNQYVAVFKGQLVAHSRDSHALIAGLKDRYPDAWHLFAVHYITAEDLRIAV